MEKEFKKRLEKILGELSDEEEWTRKHGSTFHFDPKDEEVVKVTKQKKFVKVFGKHKGKIAEEVAYCLLFTAYCSGSNSDTTKKVIKLIDSYNVGALKDIMPTIKEAAGSESLDRVIDLYNQPEVREIAKTYKGKLRSNIIFYLDMLAEIIQDIELVKNLVSDVSSKYKGHTLDSVIHAMAEVALTTHKPELVKEVVEISNKYKGRSVDAIMNTIIKASLYAEYNPLEVKPKHAKFVENLIKSQFYEQ